MKKQKIKFQKIALIFIFCFIIFSIFNVDVKAISNVQGESKVNNQMMTAREKQKIYLSDLDYITDDNWSYNGWAGHDIQNDKNQEGNSLSLIIDNEKRFFTKGVSIHAKGQATYDIEELSTKYPRFIAYMGVDASRGTNGSVWFEISVSNDGKAWEKLLTKTEVFTGTSNALEVDLDVEGYKYLRIYVDSNGGNAADHSTIANACLVTSDFDKNTGSYDKLHNLDYYDQILEEHDVEYNYNNNYRLVLERELVRKLGYWNIQEFAEHNSDIINTLNWILSKNEIIEQIIEVGELGNSSKFLQVLMDLYSTYKDELTKTDGYVYQKMMIALSATYSSDRALSPLRFSAIDQTYDYVERFRVMKELYDNDLLMIIENNNKTGNFIPNEWFKDYHIELMRLTMQNGISNEEFLWLNGYTHYKESLNEAMVPYLQPNYAQSKLYDESNRKLYTEKYLLDQYNIPYGDNTQRYWMVFEAGGICWNQSRLAQAMYRVNGIPAVGAYQPGHELYINYYQDENGKGFWTPRYGNWGDAGSTWGGGQRYRYIFDWGNKYFTDQNISGPKGGTSTGYIYLAQENLNHYAEYKKSLYYNLIANSYKDNAKKLETYDRSLEINNINLDTYDYKINIYKQMTDENLGGTITSEQWYDLAKDIIDAYDYYPVAMFDLLKVIRPYLDDVHKLHIDRLEEEALVRATKATEENTNSVDGTKTHANQLLGKVQPDPMSFSFDGENAGKIVKNPIYDLSWSYSLDGGKTFSSMTQEEYVMLSKEEIDSITAENDIIIDFMGLPDFSITIDIEESQGLPNTIYANDWENQLIAATPFVQWKLNEQDEWVSYQDGQPDLTGNKTLMVRMGATQRYLPSEEIVTYTFTEDDNPENRKYIPIKHLSIDSVSTEATAQGRFAKNAIDGNIKTSWHSAWNGSDTEKFIVIALDEPKNVTALEFFPLQGGNGKIESAQILTSMNGTDWTEVVSGTDWTYTDANDVSMKSVDFEASRAKYIKIVGKKTQNSYIAASMFNFYEDTTKVIVATFSFDGEDAGKIILEDEYKQLNWKYSLDGGNAWKQANQGEHQLTKQEISQINANNKIKIKFEGNDVEYTIGISKGIMPTVTPYVNDWENTLIGLQNQDKLEWKLENDTTWTDYRTQIPRVQGNNKLLVRAKATGINTASEPVEFQFSKDTDTDTEKYVRIEHLSVHDKISESIDTARPFYAPNAIDGNINTLWHTDFSHSVLDSPVKPFITLKLDSTRYLSALEFAQKSYKANDPCFTKNAIVYVSEDGNEWIEVGRKENCDKNEDFNKITFDKVIPAQYVKLELETYDIFAAISMINIYEDTTKMQPPTAEIEYSTKELTNNNVTVKLVNESTNITVTNNNGSKQYIFTENGEFTFEFVDELGNRGSTTAKVDWIDKKAPTAEVEYSIKELTNGNVIVTLINESEEIIVTNNNGSRQYIFTENGEFTFEFVDKAGNKGTVTANVDWIQKDEIPDKQQVGDINGDGKITATDLLLVKRHLVAGNKQEWILTENHFKAGDINGDGKITATDLLLVKRLVLKQIKEI